MSFPIVYILQINAIMDIDVNFFKSIVMKNDKNRDRQKEKW